MSLPSHISHPVLHGHLHGEPLSAADDAHLVGCARCQQALAQVERTQQLFHEMRAEEPDELRWRRIRLGLKGQLPAPQPRRRPGPRRWAWLVAVAAAATLALLPLLGRGGLWGADPSVGSPQAAAVPAPAAPLPVALPPADGLQLPGFTPADPAWAAAPLAPTSGALTAPTAAAPLRRLARRAAAGRGKVEVRVDVDPARVAWEAAQRAYYQDADYAEAVRQAQRVLAGEDLGLYLAAQGLICDAEVAAHAGAAAIQACDALIGRVTQAEERQLQVKIAGVYRELGDFARAMQRYDRALDGADDNILYDPVRLSRARCAVELGAWAKAERQLRQLRAPGRAVRAAELDALRVELERRRGADRRDHEKR